MSRRPGAEFTLNELVVLSLLHERELYGVEIVKAAAATSAAQASMGTIYPLLKDLVRDGLLSSRRGGRQRGTGSPCIYYRLTDHGRARLTTIAARWAEVHDSVSELLAGLPIQATENPMPAPTS